MTKPITWFGTWLPLIKLGQAVCLAVITLLFLDGREQWYVYNMIFLFSFIMALLVLFSILFAYFEIRTNHKTEYFLNLVSTILCFLFATILLWDVWNMRKGPHHYKYHSRLAPYTIGQEAWIRRCVIVACTLLLTAVLFLITFLKLYRSRG